MGNDPQEDRAPEGITTVSRRIIQTPLGWLGIAATERGICRIVLPNRNRAAVQGELGGPEVGLSELLNRAVEEVQRYFRGLQTEFDLPLDIPRATAFQRSVWQATARIPCGETTTYGMIARAIGRPRATRAVGSALGANPVPIIVPCHRVVSADGGLGGFSAGTELKRRLLEREAGRRQDLQK